MLRNVIHGSAGETYFFLNEVLSLNAQEFLAVLLHVRASQSSMKS